MTWKSRNCFAVGPVIHVGNVTIIRLWLWDYLRVGVKKFIVWHDVEEWKAKSTV